MNIEQAKQVLKDSGYIGVDQLIHQSQIFDPELALTAEEQEKVKAKLEPKPLSKIDFEYIGETIQEILNERQ